jgi:hypothetical protein
MPTPIISEQLSINSEQLAVSRLSAAYANRYSRTLKQNLKSVLGMLVA